MKIFQPYYDRDLLTGGEIEMEEEIVPLITPKEVSREKREKIKLKKPWV